MSTQASDRRKSRSHIRLIAGWCVFWILTVFILDLPDHPDAITAEAFQRIPLELPVLAGLFLLLPSFLGRILRLTVLAAASVILFLKLADIGTQAAFQRPFNPYLDAKMLLDGWNLASGTLGAGKAGLVVLGCALAFGIVIGLYGKSLTWVGATPAKLRRILLPVAATLSLTGLVALGLGSSRWTGDAGAYLWRRTTLVASSVQDMAAFEAQLTAGDDITSHAGLFDAVSGRDVVLIFVESYGRSAVEDPQYAALIQPRLATMENDLSRAGFSSASRWVTSPTVAGLSWLAHGTLLSGLWVDSQARYDRLIRSNRPTLNRLFSAAGWSSVAVMPAITMNWPESAYFGYDRVLAAKDLGYAGRPFNWITMPDQYTLLAFQRMLRDTHPRKPVMAEIALISSHAPWTPVARMVDWNAIGDGAIFDAQAQAGPSPAEVWANPDSVRRFYIQTIDYSLQAISGFIETYGGDALFIVIGDHQPAALVTGPNASRSVPLHIISRSRMIVDRFASRGFLPGLRPGSTEEIGMDRVRDLLIKVLGNGDLGQ